jgi:hypothetical protein
MKLVINQTRTTKPERDMTTPTVQRINEHGDTVHIAWTMELSPNKHIRAATVGRLITDLRKPATKEKNVRIEGSKTD